jgi:glycolate oxidase FAD binding subunit
MTAASQVNLRIAELVAIAGRQNVIEDPARLTEFAVDGVVPGAVIVPASAEEVAAVLRVANLNDLLVAARGGGTRDSCGQIPDRVDLVLTTERMNAVERYDPGDLTICIQAGARVDAIQKLVRESQQLLPMDVARPAEATIGGVLASRDSGPLKHRFGGPREYCIGITFVTGDGRQGKGGGRVVKNVAGYDMMKLMIGSHGTLCVITSANFKLFPAARQTCTFAAEFSSVRESLEFRRGILRSPLSPLALELITPRAHDYLGSGAGTRWSVLVRAGGSETVLARCRRELGASVTKEIEGSEEESLWERVSNFSEQAVSSHANVMLVDLNVPSSELQSALEAVERIALQESFLMAGVGRCAVATMVLAFIPISVDPPSAMKYVNLISGVRAQLGSGSAAVITRCPLEVKRHVNVWGSSSSDVEAMRAIKRALDPKDVLNRGRFLF